MALVYSIWDGNRFLGVEWHLWKVLGWTGNIIFFSRFLVQWIATEKHKRIVVPISFWWLSLTGSVLLLSYGLWQRDSVFIFAYAFTWIPYIRSIIIHHRQHAAQLSCGSCSTLAPGHARFCHECGTKLARPELLPGPTPNRPCPELVLRPIARAA